jgi:hypothetical protein
MLRRVSLVALAAALLVVLFARSAAADTSRGQNNGIAQRSPNPSHPVPFAFSFEDCKQDVVYTWGISVDNVSDVLQVWAAPQGVDCTDPTQRTAPGGQCWPVTAQMVTSNSFQVPVHGRDVTAHMNDPQNTTRYSFSGPAGISACYTQTSAPAQTFTLSFLLFQGATAVSGQTAFQYQLKVDILGPPSPCTNGQSNGDGFAHSIGIGDGELILSFLPPVSSDVFGMRVFCTPSPTADGAAQGALDLSVAPIVTGAGNSMCGLSSLGDSGGTTAGDGSTASSIHTIPLQGVGTDAAGAVDANADGADAADMDAAGTDSAVSPTDGNVDANPAVDAANSAACGSALVDGMNGSDIPSGFDCGDFGGNGGVATATIQGLTNGQVYSFAVGAVDQVGNAGPITFLGCSSPEKIVNFYGAYTQAGGTAGGGFCSASATRGSDAAEGAGTAAALGAAGALMAAAVVRRKRRNKR